jgi:hypothetical protein
MAREECFGVKGMSVQTNLKWKIQEALGEIHILKIIPSWLEQLEVIVVIESINSLILLASSFPFQEDHIYLIWNPIFFSS